MLPFLMSGQPSLYEDSVIVTKDYKQDNFELKLLLAKSKSNLFYFKYTLKNNGTQIIFIDTSALYASYFKSNIESKKMNTVLITMEEAPADGFRILTPICKNEVFNKTIYMDNNMITFFDMRFLWFYKSTLKAKKVLRINSSNYKISNVFYSLYSKRLSLKS